MLGAYLVKKPLSTPDLRVIRIEQGYEIHRLSLLICRSGYEGEDIRVDVGGNIKWLAGENFSTEPTALQKRDRGGIIIFQAYCFPDDCFFPDVTSQVVLFE